MFNALKEAFSDKKQHLSKQYEYFTSSTQGPAQQQLEFVESQQQLYNTVLPNLIPVRQAAADHINAEQQSRQLANSMGIAQPITGTVAGPINQPASIFQNMEIPESLKELQRQCLQTNVDVLATSQNPAASTRCGWLYKESTGTRITPEISTGFLGTAEGPFSFFDPPQGARWIWDINEAKRTIQTDLCNKLKRCEDVEQADFKGKCGYCPSLGKGVPINSRGEQLYPNDIRTSCMDVNLLKTVGSCPPPAPPPPPGSPAAVAMQLRAAETCDTMSDGSISRQCLMNKLLDSKCRTDGALYIALQNSLEPANYLSGVSNNAAFMEYQKRANIPLPSEALKRGQITTNTALSAFNELYKDATSPDDYTAIATAARDLCLKAGDFDSFDFCSELRDTTPGPFSIECLQREFRKMGGQPAGSAYPTQQNMNVWNSFATWRAVRDKINDIVSKTKSSNMQIQRTALRELLGIERDSSYLTAVPKYNMYDTLWFIGENRIGRTPGRALYGRRIYDSGLLPGVHNGWGNEMNGLPFGHLVYMILMANLRVAEPTNVKWKIVTDDRASIVVNRFAPNVDEWNQSAVRDEPGLFHRWYDQPPTMHQSATETRLTQGGKNFLKAMWTERWGYSQFEMNMSTNGGSFGQIPYDMLTLNQEPDAPYLSFEVRMRDGYGGNTGSWHEFRNPEILYLSRMDNIQYEMSRPNYRDAPGAAPFMRLINASSIVELGTPILPSAWKTITLAFRLDNRLSANQSTLLTLGSVNVQLVYIGSTIYAVCMGQRIPMTIEQGKWYLLAVSQIPNESRISASITPFSGGTPVSVNVLNKKLDQGYNLVGENVTNSDFGFLTLGGAGVSAIVSCAWLHVFDRIFNDAMIRKEMNAEWMRAWI